jgi:hypothetical protein
MKYTSREFARPELEVAGKSALLAVMRSVNDFLF